METSISGLHSCRPGNEPTPGETKTFTVEQRTGKSGKAWNKIKAASPDAGGQPYRVKSVQPTDYKDNYGNVSMNLEIEPSDGSQSTQVAPQRAANNGSGDERGQRIERQHSQHMALLHIAAKGGEFPDTETLRALIDWYHRDVGRMPAAPAAKPEPEPEHDDAPKPDEEEAF